MIKRIARDLPHYISLFGLLFISFMGFFVFSYDRVFQQSITIAMGVSYVAWGVIHHYLHRDLHLSVVLEYMAVAVVGIVIVYSLILTP